MQQFLAKYGLAAHLALLAVAPLFLFPFCSDAAVATTLLWLTLLAAVWCFLAPSVRRGEHLHMARARVLSSAARDPLFWVSLALAVFAGGRALNDGVRMAYDAEKATWGLAVTAFPYYPGCTDGAGFLPFAVLLALVAVFVATRQALGRSARLAFLLMAAAGAGLAAVVLLVAAHAGQVACVRLMAFPNTNASFVGVAFGLHLLGGVAALLAAFERKWASATLLAPLSVGGTALGAFAFAPPAFAALAGVAGLAVFGLSFVVALRNLRKQAEFRLLVVFALALAVGGLLVGFLMPEAALSARLDAFARREIFPEGFLAVRRTLSDLALRAWQSAPWIGTGLGSFGLDIRFHARAADWSVIPRGQAAVPNGGWLLLAERGIVGAALFALPLGFLVFTYVRRLVAWAKNVCLPHPACLLAPLVLVLVGLDACVGCSFLRADVLLVACAELAVAAKSFPSLENHPNV